MERESLDTPQGEYLRCWDILVPSDLETPVPLLLDLHGYSSSKTGQRGLSGFEEIAVREGFVVAWPQGIQRSWNAGGIQWLSPREAPEVPGQGCCGTAFFEEIDDVGFIRDMVAQLIRQYPIDPKRVYVTGLSNGCARALSDWRQKQGPICGRRLHVDVLIKRRADILYTDSGYGSARNGRQSCRIPGR
ncbi:MAG: hypothetical protein Ct9H300mP8_06160 [Gammaproteobacteria bacterium]|nr:MAG: hypothetical protein Ct9H300mP8_06160 [Gammaproteobacteria bacterium]